jgi:hypothetical protein
MSGAISRYHRDSCHVDSTAGISVFYYLKNLHAGDTVDVTLADQATGHYTDNIIVYAHLVSAGS